MLLRDTPNARIFFNLAKENPHIDKATRQIVLAEQFCLNSAIFRRSGMREPARYKGHTASSAKAKSLACSAFNHPRQKYFILKSSIDLSKASDLVRTAELETTRYLAAGSLS